MTVYEKQALPAFLCVDALVSIYHVNFRHRTLKNKPNTGEAHSFPEFVYVESGTFDILVDGELFSLCAGQCIIYPPCAHHAAPRQSSAVVDIIGFDSSSPALTGLYRRIMDVSEKQRQRLTEIMYYGFASFQDAPMGRNMTLRKNADAVKLHKLKNCLELFLIDLYEDVMAGPKLVYQNYKLKQFDEVAKYLKANIDKSLTLEKIASSCGMSVPKLKLLFSEQCDLSPMAYFSSLKIEKAKELIRGTSLNFTQISEMLGFKTVYYFSSRFKQKTGMSPLAYKRTL